MKRATIIVVALLLAVCVGGLAATHANLWGRSTGPGRLYAWLGHRPDLSDARLAGQSLPLRPEDGFAGVVAQTRVQAKRTFFTEAPAEQVRQLESDMEAKKDELQSIETQIELVRQNRSNLNSLAGRTDTFALALASGEMSVESHRRLYDDLRSQMEMLDSEMLKLGGQKRELERQIEKLKNELKELTSARPRKRYSAQVEIDVLEAGDLTLELMQAIDQLEKEVLTAQDLFVGEDAKFQKEKSALEDRLEEQRSILQRIPLGCTGRPEDIALQRGKTINEIVGKVKAVDVSAAAPAEATPADTSAAPAAGVDAHKVRRRWRGGGAWRGRRRRRSGGRGCVCRAERLDEEGADLWCVVAGDEDEVDVEDARYGVQPVDIRLELVTRHTRLNEAGHEGSDAFLHQVGHADPPWVVLHLDGRVELEDLVFYLQDA